MSNRMTAAAAESLYAEKFGTFEFTLSRTLDPSGQPYTVLARIPDVTDFSMLADATHDQQQYIFKVMEGTEDIPDFEDIDPNDPEELERNLAHLQHSEHLIAYYITQGIVEPRFYSTPEEAAAKGGAYYGVIDYWDRIAFLQHCTGQKEAAAAVAAPFRAGQDGPVHKPSDGKNVRRGAGGPRRNQPAAAGART